MLGEPELLVLDEPTVGLDPVLRNELWGLFRALADRGVTLIVSSHVMDEALRCDRLILMRAGRIIADTTPDGLLADTGQTDPDAAFLTLIERDVTSGSAPAPADGAAGPPAPPAAAPPGPAPAAEPEASDTPPDHPLTRREARGEAEK